MRNCRLCFAHRVTGALVRLVKWPSLATCNIRTCLVYGTRGRRETLSVTGVMLADHRSVCQTQPRALGLYKAYLGRSLYIEDDIEIETDSGSVVCRVDTWRFRVC